MRISYDLPCGFGGQTTGNRNLSSGLCRRGRYAGNNGVDERERWTRWAGNPTYRDTNSSRAGRR